MKEFKVGDKVRCNFKEGVWFDHMMPLQGAVGLVLSESERNGSIFVKFGNATYEVPIYILELVTPADPKREFLECLQSLLREFDAKMDIGLNVDGEVGRCGVLFDVNNDRIFFPIVFTEMDDDPAIIAQRRFTNYPITADNIMDFDEI